MKSTSINGSSEPQSSSEPRGSTRAAADVPAIVIILKKTQGSVWSEAGRTPLCPTLGWLSATYGAGQYELQLKRGNRILCMTPALCAPEPGSRPAASRNAGGSISSGPVY